MASSRGTDRQAHVDETTSLLRARSEPSGGSQQHHLPSDAPCSALFRLSSMPKETSHWHETGVLVVYSLPLVFSRLVQRYCIVLGPITAMGKYGATYLAAGGLANATLNILMIAPIYGIGSVLDTLGTQSAGSQAGQQQRASETSPLRSRPFDLNMLYSLRVLVVMCGTMLCIMPLLLHAQPLFLLLGVQAQSAAMAARYLRLATIGLPGFIGYEILRKYCQSQGRMMGPAVAGVVAAPFALVFLHSHAHAEDTPPLTIALYFTVASVAQACWAGIVLPSGTFTALRPPGRLVMRDLGIVIKLGVAGTVSTCADWWAWEFLAFASARLGDAELAANGIFLASASFFSAVSGALMNSSSTRVGNYLGRNEPSNAKIAAHTALLMGAAVAGLAASAAVTNSTRWTSLFTEDPQVEAIVGGAFGFFAAIIWLDAVQGVYGGILRGAGLPVEIAWTMAFSHYAIGLPLAAVFAFSSLRWGLLGLWSGFGIGLICVCLRLTWLTVRNDWEEGARKAQQHLAHVEAEHRAGVDDDEE